MRSGVSAKAAEAAAAQQRAETRTHSRPLTDEELRQELEARHVICLVDQQLRFQEVERQVERLGFGEAYIISATQRPGSGVANIRLTPAPN